MKPKSRNIQELFFHLLRSGLWSDGGYTPEGGPTGAMLNESCKTLSDADWRSLLAIAKSQTVMGVVADGIQNSGCGTMLPNDIRSKLLGYTLKLENTHRQMNTTLAEISAMLDKDGIPCVLLKGHGLAANYPIPPTSPMWGYRHLCG